MNSAHDNIEFMGTTADINIRDEGLEQGVLDAALAEAFERLREIEATFSVSDGESEISRLGRGEITAKDAGADIQDVLNLSETMRSTTNGFFDIYAAASVDPAAKLQASDLPDAKPLDPSILVRGWAVEQVVELLRRAGTSNFYVNIGGDLFAAGSPEPGQVWGVGLSHPDQPPKVNDDGTHEMYLMAMLGVVNKAVATAAFSGPDLHMDTTLETPTEIVSVTIVGEDISLAVSYASATLAMGLAGMEWAGTLPGFDVFIVTNSGQAHWTNDFNRHFVNPPGESGPEGVEGV